MKERKKERKKLRMEFKKKKANSNNATLVKIATSEYKARLYVECVGWGRHNKQNRTIV
jgi:hypothetical protein